MLMGWNDRHAHAFHMQARSSSLGLRGASSCVGKSTVVDEERTIADALTMSHDSFVYAYDLAGEWRVAITRAPGVWRGRTKSEIVCLDGYLAGPRDDGGGPKAYSAVLAATLGRGPKLTAKQMEWVGANFDPERFDRCAVNRALAGLEISAAISAPAAPPAP